MWNRKKEKGDMADHDFLDDPVIQVVMNAVGVTADDLRPNHGFTHRRRKPTSGATVEAARSIA